MTDDRVARLYGLPLEEFTPERNALAAELRAAGDGEGAAAVKALRKPSAAAWAVNRLVRAEPELLEALLGAGGELRQAHRQAASGRGAEQMRAAAQAERAAVEALMSRAREALGRVPPAALADAIRNTLHAASSDDEAREQVATGTLTRELRPVGLGPVPKGGADVKPARAADTGKARKADEQRAAREARQRAAEQARALKGAQAAESALEREVEAALRSLERAEESLARAREAADAAEARARDARKRLRAAKSELTQAQRRRARLERDDA